MIFNKKELDLHYFHLQTIRIDHNVETKNDRNVPKCAVLDTLFVFKEIQIRIPQLISFWPKAELHFFGSQLFIYYIYYLDIYNPCIHISQQHISLYILDCIAVRSSVPVKIQEPYLRAPYSQNMGQANWLPVRKISVSVE